MTHGDQNERTWLWTTKIWVKTTRNFTQNDATGRIQYLVQAIPTEIYFITISWVLEPWQSQAIEARKQEHDSRREKTPQKWTKK